MGWKVMKMIFKKENWFYLKVDAVLVKNKTKEHVKKRTSHM